MKKSEFTIQEIELIINHAFQEDIGSGDITTNNLVPENTLATASMTAKADGIVAGLDIAEMVFRKLDANLEWFPKVKDGDRVAKGDVILEIKGTYRALLTGERLALNLMQRMSGIATETAKYVAEAKGTKVKILDTRKTVPGLRTFDKYAVKMGGGTNHRIGLYDMVMIKDNHIKIAGSITTAVAQIRKAVPSTIKVEVETTNFDEVKEAVSAGADIIMLDNMSNEAMKEAVHFIDGKALVEASGNMNIERIAGVAKTGVDFISIGALTHSVTALDISQNIILK
ncbi:nicotinate-nucleotide diphosphorylase (carboxylating) [Labilibaculum filiforme]|uniref:Probable nicotinate-nucleotide pyrophosphorylase [carboxylating] n=1 Tax=Labilibaculum filiforme TaxID=1940526 RepID=A0A2N3HYQ7_9BACT|nr:carboxylating nicotinate-nucleotide diphosphorylase [Labilibaculum filiforme]PKQ63200.1 nicotinate-nucleotide diphosphorylase (carboxylating) [Labilibaculum filiforme]